MHIFDGQTQIGQSFEIIGISGISGISGKLVDKIPVKIISKDPWKHHPPFLLTFHIDFIFLLEPIDFTILIGRQFPGQLDKIFFGFDAISKHGVAVKVQSIQIEFFCILIDGKQNIVGGDFKLIFFPLIYWEELSVLRWFCIAGYFSTFGLAIQPHHLPNFGLALEELDVLGETDSVMMTLTTKSRPTKNISCLRVPTEGKVLKGFYGWWWKSDSTRLSCDF